MNLKIFLAAITLFFSISAIAQNYDIERSKYTKALKYHNKKNYKEFDKLKEELVNYPLYSDLEYKSLHRKKFINDDKVIQFIQNYKNSYSSEKAYINLIYRLSSTNQINKLIVNYKKIDSVDLHCLYLRARIKKKSIEGIDGEIIPLWLSAKSQPKSCNYVFKWFYKNKKLSDELVWQRIKLSLDANNYNLARYLVRFLSNKNQIWANNLLKVYRNPKNNIMSDTYKEDSRYRSTIFSYGLDRISKKDYIKAKNYLSRLEKKYKFSDTFYNQKMLDIFIIAMKSNQKNISKDKDFLLLKTKSSDFNLAYANYSIFNSDWGNLLISLNNLPDFIAEKQKWTYWKGKAMYMLGKNNNYKVVLENLSTQRSYYGFLAANVLGKKINIESRPPKVNKEDLRVLQENFDIKRIYELFLLGKHREARMELHHFYKYSKHKNLNNLNVLFNTWGWSEGAILGYGHTKYFDDVNARFPVLYENYFDMYSNSNLQKSLLLSIARKESIFIQYAKSSAGAFGIMQVLPQTAYWVLRKNKMKKVSRNYLYNKKMNIFIGSYYFKYLLSKNKSYVEAIASYNAGPSVVRKWRKENHAPEDAWIEFIPYSETRKYVKLVLEYSLVYDWVLNKKNTIRVSQLIDTKN